MTKILILGGTKEAARLAGDLVEKGHEVTTSLAGRTREPDPPIGGVRIGGFGGIDGLADYLISQNIEQLIDATHPFARQISKNAIEAAKKAGVPLHVKVRPPWTRDPKDHWIEVNSLEEARSAIPPDARVLLALGSQHIAHFADRSDVFYLVRMVDEPAAALPLANYTLLIGKPGKTAQEEIGVLKSHRITHIVCRNSGGKGAYAKIEAARKLCLPVIIVSYPQG